MRNMNCRNVRREIDEAGPDALLSVAVNTHIEECVACETLAREQSKLQAIISTLGTVEAPGDFDFRLRARLAGERSGTARPFGLSDFSFGFRSAAVLMVLLVIGAAFAVVSFRTRLANPATPGGSQVASKSGTVQTEGRDAVKPSVPGVDAVSKDSKADVAENGLGSRDGTQKRRVVGGEVAAVSGGSRVGTREMSGTQAPVLRRYDQLAGTYPTAAFPIDASYQSLKVSVDDGRGTSRTISLPTVSFGSQRALSQNASLSMVSARGDW